jgi:hypothetical protein
VYPTIEERHRLLSWVKEGLGNSKAREIGTESVDEVKVEHNGKDIVI